MASKRKGISSEKSSKKSFKIGKILGKAIPALIILILIIVALNYKGDNQTNTTTESEDNNVQVSYPSPNADQFSNTLIAENDQYQLYLDGSTLSVTIVDKLTGKSLESSVKEEDEKSNTQWLGFMKSGVVLNVIQGKESNINDTLQADMVNNKTQISIEKIDNGFHAYLTFTDYGISFEMNVTLSDDSLDVEIPDKSIVESNNKYSIGAINVFPFLGYSYLGEKSGYMFIPDGNGALIYLNDKEGRISGGFSKMVYGTDAGFKDSQVENLLWDDLETVNEDENVLAPVFGMVHTDDQLGYLGIIESGAQRASIEAYPNGSTIDYNRIYAKFIMRKVYNQPTSQSGTNTVTTVEKERSHYDIKVKYCLVSGDDANYTGLAVRYRNYLLDEGGLAKKDSAYNTRIDFLGTEREDWLLTKRKVVMTTVDNIRDIYSDLNAEGVANIFSLYKGWQNGGLNDLPVKSYKADSAIGGTSELTKFIKQLQGTGNQLYLYDDALRYNSFENSSTFNTIKRVDKRQYQEEIYKDVYDYFLFLTPSRSGDLADQLEKSFLKKGVTNVALAGITNNLFSYSYSGNYYTRLDTMQEYDSIISGMDQDFSLALEQPFAYLWKYTDDYLDMPVGTSNYVFADQEIPFMSIVLKGVIPMYSNYVNFEANQQEFYLKLIETGIFPSFYITNEDSSKLIYTNSSDIYSSKYSIYKEQIIQYSNDLKSVNDAVKDAYIIGHERLDNGVTVVSYDNGVNIYINYSDSDQTVDGYTIKAMAYKVGEAK